ncbi:homocysteine S-methyltransferase [Desmospora activa]|uniref:S-methylmethionine:homocysteine methyltransferase n=1 Tax=Desmospora activa DSM 45169 TaxID=1121389 RepID=A0A2T4Z7K9_9BACL|nr:homocysteine S-methyltransferase [Desmospora activa]PTM57855.1 homocysteine S-methyltransferase [Desmospora activa DSM 45169]
MNPIEVMLQTDPVIILDGAMATELERHGCDLNDQLWSAKILLENPDLIKLVHLDYFEAGADCAITASYQATIEGMTKRGLSEAEAITLIRLSVELAVQARDQFWAKADHSKRPRPLVAASIGPYGAYLADGSEYRGDYGVSEEALIDFHRPRMKALIEAGADILACETIPCLQEARALVRLLQEFPGAYAWITFSAKDEQHISDGESISTCAAWLDRFEQVSAVGINCTPPRYLSSLITEIKRHTSKPIIVYPNSGEQYDPVTKSWTGPSSSEGFGRSARHWYECGARIIGGCCRTKPEDIQAIAAWARGE